MYHNNTIKRRWTGNNGGFIWRNEIYWHVLSFNWFIQPIFLSNKYHQFSIAYGYLMRMCWCNICTNTVINLFPTDYSSSIEGSSLVGNKGFLYLWNNAGVHEASTFWSDMVWIYFDAWYSIQLGIICGGPQNYKCSSCFVPDQSIQGQYPLLERDMLPNHLHNQPFLPHFLTCMFC